MHFRFTGAARRSVILVSAAAIGIVAGAAEYKAEVPEAHNMRLVGYNDLQARSAYQPVIHEQGGRQIAYVGHHGGPGAAEYKPDVAEARNMRLMGYNDLQAR